MKVALVCWLAALFFAWLLVGNSLEQLMIASKVLFIGLVLGVIGGKLSIVIEKYRYAKQRSK